MSSRKAAKARRRLSLAARSGSSSTAACASARTWPSTGKSWRREPAKRGRKRVCSTSGSRRMCCVRTSITMSHAL